LCWDCKLAAGWNVKSTKTKKNVMVGLNASAERIAGGMLGEGVNLGEKRNVRPLLTRDYRQSQQSGGQVIKNNMNEIFHLPEEGGMS